MEMLQYVITTSLQTPTDVIASAATAITDLKQKMIQQTNSKKQLEEQFHALKHCLAQKHEESQSIIESHSEEKALLQQQLSQLQDEVKEGGRAAEVTSPAEKNTQEAISAAAENHQQEILTLNNTISQLKSDLDSVESQAVMAKESNRDIVHGLERQLQHTRQQLQVCQQECEDSNLASQVAEAAKEEAEQKWRHCATERNTLQSEVARLETDLKELRECMNELKAERTAFQHEATKAQQQVIELETQATHKDAQIAALSKAQEVLEQQQALELDVAVKTATDDLKADNRQLVVDADKLRNTNNLLKLEITRLLGEIDTRDCEAASRIHCFEEYMMENEDRALQGELLLEEDYAQAHKPNLAHILKFTDSLLQATAMLTEAHNQHTHAFSMKMQVVQQQQQIEVAFHKEGIEAFSKEAIKKVQAMEVLISKLQMQLEASERRWKELQQQQHSEQCSYRQQVVVQKDAELFKQDEIDKLQKKRDYAFAQLAKSEAAFAQGEMHRQALEATMHKTRQHAGAVAIRSMFHHLLSMALLWGFLGRTAICIFQ